MRNPTDSGFTLIELLMVVVIIGLLASIAIPKFASTREKAYLASLRADLHNLATQQDIYYNDGYTFTTSVSDLDFTTTDGVVITFGEADNLGWSASAYHVALGTTQACAIYHGSASAVSPATVVSVVQCTS